MTFFEYKTVLQNDYDTFTQLWHSSSIYSYFDFIKEKQGLFYSLFKNDNIDTNIITKTSQQFVREIKERTYKENIGELFVAIKALKNEFQVAGRFSDLTKSKSVKIEKSLDALWNILNILVRDPNNYANIMQSYDVFMSIDKEIENIIMQIFAMNEIDENITEHIKIDEHEAEYFIQLFDINLNLVDFINRLSLINKIYEETCSIVGVDHILCPLKIVKIEYGSLFAQIKGNDKAINFIDWFLRNVIKVVYKRFSFDGKVERISQKYDVLEKEIGYLSKLKELVGKEEFDTIYKDNSENISKATAVLSKSTTQLIAGVTKINSNNEILSIENDLQQKYLEETKRLLIDNPSIEEE